MGAKEKQFHEKVARFFEKPTREGLRDLLKDHYGETDNCDFKKEWPKLSNLPKHILGFANSKGGVIVFGVEQKDDNTLEPCGMQEIKDKADVEKGIRKYIPANLEYIILDFSYDSSEYPKLIGKRFQVIVVEDNPRHIPYVCESESESTRTGAIYIRRGTQTIEAGYDELQKLINRRIETGYTSTKELALQEHLEQLKMLYQHVQRYYYKPGKASIITSIAESMKVMGLAELYGEKIDNPNYPKETYEDFIIKIIEQKKLLIMDLLGIRIK